MFVPGNYLPLFDSILYSLLLETDNVLGQISEHIFEPNGGFPIRHDNVIDLMMKITGRIILKTTFRCPHDTIIRAKYNSQQITRMLMFIFKFLVPKRPITSLSFSS